MLPGALAEVLAEQRFAEAGAADESEHAIGLSQRIALVAQADVAMNIRSAMSEIAIAQMPATT